MTAKQAAAADDTVNERGNPKLVQKMVDGIPQFEADGKTAIMVKKVYKRRPDMLLGVTLHAIPGDTLVNPHGQAIIDELILKAKPTGEKNADGSDEELVDIADVKALRGEAFEAVLQRAAKTKQKVDSIVSGWLTILRKCGFIQDKRVLRKDMLTRGPNANISRRLAPVIKTREQILAERAGTAAGVQG